MFLYKQNEQECIQAGCMPPASMAISTRGMYGGGLDDIPPTQRQIPPEPRQQND